MQEEPTRFIVGEDVLICEAVKACSLCQKNKYINPKHHPLEKHHTHFPMPIEWKLRKCCTRTSPVLTSRAARLGYVL